MHVRRGDYATNPQILKIHGFCGVDYYTRALEKFNDLAPSEIRVFVFSDDIKWVKENLTIPFTATYIENPTVPSECEDLILMANCKHNIIANSSYSWWGAWLNKNPEKRVITPKQWLKKDSWNTHDRIPTSWDTL